MKTAIAIDSLLLRDDSIFMLELILNLFPHSEIYTIAHKQGGILGQIETRPIVSSFLTHRAKDVSVFKKNFWIMPSASSETVSEVRMRFRPPVFGVRVTR